MIVKKTLSKRCSGRGKEILGKDPGQRWDCFVFRQEISLRADRDDLVERQ